MPPITTYLILACMGLYALIIVVDLIRERAVKRALLAAAVLVAVAGLLHLATGFPEPSHLQAFGGLGPLPVIALMFLCILAGMGASYVFHLKTRFSWLSFLKPLCVSPIVLLPLLGTLQAVSQVEPVQVLSFSFLAFQNGFFWKMILERTRTQT